MFLEEYTSSWLIYSLLTLIAQSFNVIKILFEMLELYRNIFFGGEGGGGGASVSSGSHVHHILHLLHLVVCGSIDIVVVLTMSTSWTPILSVQS